MYTGMWNVEIPKRLLHCETHGNTRGPEDSGLIGEMCSELADAL
jgi:hypothetical protein